MTRFYLGLTRVLDTTLLGILIGIISGAVINIVTGQSISKYMLFSIVFLGLSLLILILLIRYRQAIDDDYSKRQDIKATPTEHWKAAADASTGRLVYFFSLFTICIALLVVGIIFTAKGRDESITDQEKIENGLNREILMQKDIIDHLKLDTLNDRRQILVLVDSIGKFNKKPIPSVSNRTTKVKQKENK
jgi:hypothetical protein